MRAPWLVAMIASCGDEASVPRCDDAKECAGTRGELARLQEVCWDDPASEPRMMIPTPRMAYAGCCGDAAGRLEAKCGVKRELRSCVERWVEACPAGFRP